MVRLKDYGLVALIGACFALFSVPIFSNIQTRVEFSLPLVLGLMVGASLFAVVALWVASLIAKRIPVILQVAKFSAVGAFNTFLDWGILNILIAAFSIATGAWFSVFKGVSFIVANAGSYFWNKYWTFQSQERASAREFGKFFSVSVIGAVLNVGVASAIVAWVHAFGQVNPIQWANVAAVVATVISLVWNFVGYKFLVFTSKSRKLFL